MGTLKITGRLELKQFWPQGKEDADTTQLKLKVDSFSFAYSTVNDYNSPSFNATSAFLNADVKSQGETSPIIKYRNSPKRSYIKVRLQGIDAPELHYKIYDPKVYRGLTNIQKEALKAVNIEYRQKFAETAVVRLKQYIEKVIPNTDSVSVTFFSKNIDKPIDVVDVYGRFVGDILLSVGQEMINLNDWILKNGLAFPAFYNSMLEDEIVRMTKLSSFAKRDKTNKKNVWDLFSKQVKPFEFDLRFREKGVPNEQQDTTGMVLFPKVYRRYCTFSIYEKAGMPKAASFAAFLKLNKNDKYIESSDFIQGIKTEKPFSQIHDHGALEREPEQIVFVEKTNMKLVQSGSQLEIKNF